MIKHNKMCTDNYNYNFIIIIINIIIIIIKFGCIFHTSVLGIFQTSTIKPSAFASTLGTT